MWEVFDSVTGRNLGWGIAEIDAICKGITLARVWKHWDYSYCPIRQGEPIKAPRLLHFLHNAEMQGV